MNTVLRILTCAVLSMTGILASAQDKDWKYKGWEIKPIEGICITGSYIGEPGVLPMVFTAQTLSLDKIIINDRGYKQFFKELYKHAWRSPNDLFLWFKVFNALFPESEPIKNNEIAQQLYFDFVEKANEATQCVELRIGKKDTVYLDYYGIKGLFLCSTEKENTKIYYKTNDPDIFSKMKFKGISIPIAIYDCFPIDNPFVIKGNENQ